MKVLDLSHAEFGGKIRAFQKIINGLPNLDTLIMMTDNILEQNPIDEPESYEMVEMHNFLRIFDFSGNLQNEDDSWFYLNNLFG